MAARDRAEIWIWTPYSPHRSRDCHPARVSRVSAGTIMWDNRV